MNSLCSDPAEQVPNSFSHVIKMLWEIVDVSGALLRRYLRCSRPWPPYHFTMFRPSSFYRSRYDLDRARALADQRARRAQWLPDEDDDDDIYNDYRLSPYERAYLDAHRKHAQMELRRERETEEARHRALEERRRQQEIDEREKERQRCRQKPMKSKSPPVHPRTSPLPDRKAPSLQEEYTRKHVEAASVLQRFFRIRQSIHAIQSLISEFNALHASFTYPSTISFQNPSSPSADVVNVAAVDSSSRSDDIDSNTKIPKLAFNSTNYGLLAHNDALDKLLIKLDGVESWGDPGVRERRRNAVKQIEKEQGLVEKFWRMSWLKHVDIA